MQVLRFGFWALLAFTTFAYVSGLYGGFLFDDFPNIVNNPSIIAVDGSFARWLLAAFSSDAGLLRRPISMLSFALSYHLGGMNPAAFKLLNILIHLVNGFLAYRLAMLLIPLLAGRQTGDRRDAHQLLALLAAGCWLLHPLHVSSVLYAVQRMNLLSTFFILVGLLCYTQSRRALQNGTGRWLPQGLGFLLSGCLAVLSKENGALLPLYALVIEYFCFRFAAAKPLAEKAIKLAYAVGLALPTILLVIYALIRPAIVTAGYVGRDFSLLERLMTQCRVLWDYLLWTFIPNPHWMGLYHDDIAYSVGLLSPTTTVIALLGLAGMLLLAFVWRHKYPAFGFAVAWFFAGHAMESTVLPLEMVFEHRHYLPMLGILIGTAILVTQLKLKTPAVRWGLCLTIVAILCLATIQRTGVWGDPLRVALEAAKDHPKSPRSLYDAGRALLSPERPEAARLAATEQARDYFARAMSLKATDVNSAVGLMLTYQKQPSVPQDLVVALTQRLLTTPSLSPIPMLSILRVSATGRLPLTPDQAGMLVNAALENPSMDSLLRGLILSTYGYYLLEAAKDPAGAVTATMAAIELEPGYALFHLNAAYIAQKLGQPDKASRYLDAVTALDGGREYSQEASDLRAKLTPQPNSITPRQQ